jgi:hypothetical protein
MRTPFFFLLASSLVLSTCALATPLPSEDTAATVPVQHAPAYELHSRELDTYKGFYNTSNGPMLVTLEGQTLYAQFDGEKRVAMVPVAPQVFQLQQGRTRVVFELKD